MFVCGTHNREEYWIHTAPNPFSTEGRLIYKTLTVIERLTPDIVMNKRALVVVTLPMQAVHY